MSTTDQGEILYGPCKTTFRVCMYHLEKGVKRDVTKTGNGEWKMKNGEWGMENGEWGMGNGEWGMGNGEWGMGNGE